jgi:hypothetical protein
MTNNKISRGLKRAQSRLLNQNSRKILNNVFLMYIVLFASIADLLYLVSIGEHTNVIVFAVAAYITSIFSKNMSVVLIVALAITNICHLGKGIIVKEGFKESEEDPEDTDDTEDADDTEDVESSGSSDKEVSDKEVSDKEVSDKEVSDKEVSEKKNGKVSEDDSDSNEKKIKTKKIGKLPEEYKQTLAQLSDPETLKTIEGLKSLKPLLGKMERVIGMFV